MSNYWRLACADCGEEYGGYTLNHGDETFIAMGRAARLLAPLKDNAQFAAIWDFELIINNQSAPLWWFWQHDGHRIVVRDEYGREEKEVAYGAHGGDGTGAADRAGEGQRGGGDGDGGGAIDGRSGAAAAGDGVGDNPRTAR